MSAAATLTTWRGDTSIYWTRSRATSLKSPPLRTITVSLANRLFSSNGALAWAMTYFSSSSAVRFSTSSVTRPWTTLRYGLSMNPNSFTFAYMLSDEIRPMFGPSGVSIGQMRP